MNTATVAAVSNRQADHPPLKHTLTRLGRLLEYPRHGRLACSGEVPGLDLSALAALTPDQREELYTATFDVNPRCLPYLSIHLFGEENFKRGEFMAALHHQYETRGFDRGRELPDHIGTLLRYAATLEDPERRELAEFCILGPLGKLIAALDGDHPYRPLLVAADDALRAAYPGIEPALSPLEQMRQHGFCPTASPGGCSCGPIVDGPGDRDARPAPVHAPSPIPITT